MGNRLGSEVDLVPIARRNESGKVSRREGIMRMGRRERSWLGMIAVVGLIGVAGCSDSPRRPTGPAPTLIGECAEPLGFYPSNFTNSTRIDNHWFPLFPGKK